MTTSPISVVLLGLWLWLVAATFPSYTWAVREAWATRDLARVVTTTKLAVPASGIAIQTRNSASAHFMAQPSVIQVDRLDVPGPHDCNAHDISISQRQVMGKGIPRFGVSIANTCIAQGCAIRNIVAFCGQFSSARFVDPNVFRRVGAGPNCIVNNLNPMKSGQILTIEYDTEFIEPIRLSSAESICG